MADKKKKEFIIDVDVVIKKFNERNPSLRPLTRKDVAKELGVNIQQLSNWKVGKTPKIIYAMLKLMELGKCDFTDIVIERGNE